jgi:hypothetical protein
MNHPNTLSFMSAQITIANWYLDRAAQASGETSSRYVHYARAACDIVSQLMPAASADEAVQRVHQDLSVLRERLQGIGRKHNGLDGHASSSGYAAQ